jgi:hypothetical protein
MKCSNTECQVENDDQATICKACGQSLQPSGEQAVGSSIAIAKQAPDPSDLAIVAITPIPTTAPNEPAAAAGGGRGPADPIAREDFDEAKYDKLIEELKRISREGEVILITGFSDAGKTFCTRQAGLMANAFSYSTDGPRELISETIADPEGATTTLNVEKTRFVPAGEGAIRKRPWHFIDVPGEFFRAVVNARSHHLAGTDNLRIRQLAAAISIAQGIILVLPGPATLNVRQRKTPELCGGPIEAYDEVEWQRQTKAVTASMAMMPRLAAFLAAIDGATEATGCSRLEAFARYCAMPLQNRLTTLAGGRKSTVPLFIMMTKADQIFGADEECEPILAELGIDGRDPWKSLIRAGGRGHRAPYRVMIDNFHTVNLDFSASCIGGAEEFVAPVLDSVTGKQVVENDVPKTEKKKRIPYEQEGNGRGIWEPILWLLRRIDEAHDGAVTLHNGASRLALLSQWTRRLFTPKGYVDWMAGFDQYQVSPFVRRRGIDSEFKAMTDHKGDSVSA